MGDRWVWLGWWWNIQGFCCVDDGGRVGGLNRWGMVQSYCLTVDRKPFMLCPSVERQSFFLRALS